MSMLRTAAVAILVAAAAVAFAQQAAVPESLVQRQATGGSLFSFDPAAPSIFGPQPFELPTSVEDEFATDIVSGLRFQRHRKTVKQDVFGQGRRDLPLGYLFQHEDAISLSMRLTQDSELSFARKTVERRDVVGRVLSRNVTKTFGFSQRIGAGTGLTRLGFRRTVHEQQAGPNAEVKRSFEEAYSLSSGLGGLMNLGAQLTERWSEKPGEFEQQIWQLQASRGLGRWGQASWSARRELTWHGRSLTAKRQVQAAVPMRLFGQPAKLDYQRQSTVVNGRETGKRVMRFSMPLGFLSDLSFVDNGAKLSWINQAQTKNNQTTEQHIWDVNMCLRLLDRGVPTHFVRRTTASPGGRLEEEAWTWQIPFEHKAITFGYTSRQPYGRDGRPAPAQHIRVVRIPQLRLFADWASFQLQDTRTETAGQPALRQTVAAVQLRPDKRLTFHGVRSETDRGPGRVAQNTRVEASYAVAPNLGLNVRYLEDHQISSSPTIERYVGIEHKQPRAANLRLRLGYTTYERPSGQQRDPAWLAQLAVGDPKRTSLAATYQECNEKSLKPLPDKVLRFDLQHHFGSRVALRFSYLDQPGRLEPARNVQMALPLLGGQLRLSFFDNPPDPRNPKKTRWARQWDAHLERRLGGLNLCFGYRYVEFDQTKAPEQVAQFVQLSLAGGRVNGGGQLSLSYATGDFTRPLQTRVLPGSRLDLVYRRRWSDSAELSLSFARITPPWGTTRPEGYTEGRLEFRALW